MAYKNFILTTLRRSILDDLFKDFDVSRRWMRKLLEPLAWPSARFDAMVATTGFRHTMRELVKGTFERD